MAYNEQHICVLHNVPKIHIIQKGIEMIQPDLLTEQQPSQKIRRVARILKSKQQPKHRNMMKQDNIRKPECRNNKACPVPYVPFLRL